jgi:hypothetical protein
MEGKERIIRILEHYINVLKKKDVELMYGKNSSIKIKNIQYSITNKSLYLEAKIVLGEIIDESVLDRSLADLLIEDSLGYVYSDLPVKISVEWDS